MAQVPPRYCPECNTPVVPGQRFCANCGRTTTPAPAQTAHVPDAPFSMPFPPAAPLVSQQPTPAQPPPSWRITEPPVPQAPIAPSYNPRKRPFGRAGLALALLLLLVLSGAGSYLIAAAMGYRLPDFLGGHLTQTPITTTQINSTVTYAGVDLTILSAQQSQNFIDDPNTTSTGMARLTMQEQNNTTVKVSWLYNDTARLLLPDKTLVAPTYIRAHVGIAPGTTQKSFLDFAVPTKDKINQLTLRIGAANEVQLDIPLTGQADLHKYSPKNVKLDGQMLYMGLNYTLVKASSQLSIAGQQASKGMTYIVVTLKVDNTLSQQAIPGSPYDYARLKAGNTTAAPKYTDLPVSFDSGETGKSGTITFLVPQSPQSGRAFTLVLLPQSGAGQATTDFQFA